jgi:hypothetical protein
MRARTDRQTILARRAMFLASAISGIATRAGAEPACPPERAPTPDELATARELFESAKQSSERGDFDDAIRRLEEAHELTGNPRVLVTLAQVELTAGDLARAHRHARSALACDLGPARDVASKIVEETEPKIARLAIVTEPAGAELTLDGDVVATTPLDDALIVNPGRHQLVVRWPALDVSMTQVVKVAAGERRDIQLTAPPVDPCLDEPCVCLQPCLEPPLERKRRPRFGVGLGPSAWLDAMDDGFSNPGFGGRAEFFFDFPLSEIFTVRLALATMPAKLESGTLVPIGLDATALLTPRPLIVGLSNSYGYAIAGDDGDPTQRRVARSGIFLLPELLLGVELSERFTLEARGGPFFSVHETADDQAFRLGWFSAGAFLTYSFGAACQGYGGPQPCDELEPYSARR